MIERGLLICLFSALTLWLIWHYSARLFAPRRSLAPEPDETPSQYAKRIEPTMKRLYQKEADEHGTPLRTFVGCHNSYAGTAAAALASQEGSEDRTRPDPEPLAGGDR